MATRRPDQWTDFDGNPVDPATGAPLDDDAGAPSKADNARYKGEARERDRAARAAYEEGRSEAKNEARTGRGAKTSPRGRSGGSGPPKSRPEAKRAGGGSYRPLGALRGRSVAPGGGAAEEGAGLLLGLFASALAFAYLENGPDGVRAWLRAKFFNQTTATASSSFHPVATAPTTPATPAAASRPVAPTAIPTPRPAA